MVTMIDWLDANEADYISKEASIQDPADIQTKLKKVKVRQQSNTSYFLDAQCIHTWQELMSYSTLKDVKFASGIKNIHFGFDPYTLMYACEFFSQNSGKVLSTQC